MDRRKVLRLVAMAPVAAGFTWTELDVERALRRLAALRSSTAGAPTYEPAFFSPHEWRTVRLLVDMVIPADDRSGSATDAGVPEFIDFMMMDRPAGQTGMRGGLAWLDTEARRRFDSDFADAGDHERTAILDDIAWPDRARPEHSHGTAFFNSFRDLVATGFWSSRIGIDDLGYVGNTFVPEWTGCPPAALRKLGVSYDGAAIPAPGPGGGADGGTRHG